MRSESFETSLRKSHAAVEVVFEWLQSLGHQVMYPDCEVQRIEQPDGKWYHEDGGDIWLRRGDEWKRVEVKKRGFRFSPDHWPYPDVTVCETYRIDMAAPKPWMYVYVDSSMQNLAILQMDEVTLTIKSEFDNRLQRYGDFYHCPTEQAYLIGLER